MYVISFTHTVGLNLTRTAQQHWFEAGQVKGFVIPQLHRHLCFFEPFLPDSPCQHASRFLDSCEPNCAQHKKENTVLEVNSTTSLVNFKMLPPSETLDDAFVIRVRNQTVVYIAEGGPCGSTDSFFEMPMILLQYPGFDDSEPIPGPNTISEPMPSKHI